MFARVNGAYRPAHIDAYRLIFPFIRTKVITNDPPVCNYNQPRIRFTSSLCNPPTSLPPAPTNRTILLISFPDSFLRIYRSLAFDRKLYRVYVFLLPFLLSFGEMGNEIFPLDVTIDIYLTVFPLDGSMDKKRFVIDSDVSLE